MLGLHEYIWWRWSDASSQRHEQGDFVSSKARSVLILGWLSVYFLLVSALNLLLSFPLSISLVILFDIARTLHDIHDSCYRLYFSVFVTLEFWYLVVSQILLLLARWRRNLLRADQAKKGGWQAGCAQCGRCHCQIAVSSTTLFRYQAQTSARFSRYVLGD